MFTFQSSLISTHMSKNYFIIVNKMLRKNSNNVNIRLRRYLFDTTMLHQQGNINVTIFTNLLFFLENELKYYDFMFPLFEINESCCINERLHSFVLNLGTYMSKRLEIGLLIICYTFLSDKRSLRVENSRLDLKFKINN